MTRRETKKCGLKPMMMMMMLMQVSQWSEWNVDWIGKGQVCRHVVIPKHNNHVMQRWVNREHCFLRGGKYCKRKCQHFTARSLATQKMPKGRESKKRWRKQSRIPSCTVQNLFDWPRNVRWKCTKISSACKVKLQISWLSKMKTQNCLVLRGNQKTWIKK